MRRWRTIVLGAMAGLVAPALIFAGPAAAAPPIHDMRGHFAAFTLSHPSTIDNPDMRSGTLDITAQVGRVVVGRANIAGRAVVVTGTISPTDEVNLVGLGGPDTVNIRGHLLDDGGFAPCIFEGTYRVTSPRGSESGDLAAVHQVPVTGAPSIGGSWAGTIGDRGRLTATFAQSRNGVLTGRIDAVLFNPQPDPPGFEFTISGQVAWDGHTASYLLIGGADDAIVTAQLQPARDAAGAPILTGLLRLHRADGSVEETAVQLHQVGA